MIVPGAQFFSAGGRRLFGVFSPARERADAALLLCPPMLHEQIRSHRLWALLAHALAGQGISTLRFDYAGSGDSAGDSRTLDLGEAVIDAEYALAELRAATSSLPIHVLGVRLGGFVAAELARREGLPVLLWQPFEQGEQAWSELQARDLQERRSTRRFPFLRPGRTRVVAEHSVMGFALQERFANRLISARSPFDATQPYVLDADAEVDRCHRHTVDVALPMALSDWAGWIDITGPFPPSDVEHTALRMAARMRGRT